VKLGAAAREAAPALLRDLLGLASIGAITFGAWMIYHPAGWIAGGAMGLALVLISGRVA
jgi:hypothetical protein